MIVKSIVIFAFFFIIASLAYALYSLVKNKGTQPSEKALKGLTMRITLSVIVFIFVFIALATGMLEPNGIGMQMHKQKALTSEQK
jgi:uncharacterized membrane protein YedE/YeeE